MPVMTSSRQNVLEQLREQLRQRQPGQHQSSAEVAETSSTPAVSTGVSELDASLGGRGLAVGSLVEWLTAVPGSGAGTLALLAAREALRAGGVLVVCDPRGEFFPAAADEWGISLDRVVLLRPRSRADALWACDQALRCSGVSATLCDFDVLNDREFRRLQLAAEEGGGLGLLLRPAKACREPSWADVRWSVKPQVAPAAVRGRWVNIQLLRCRGGTEGTALLLEIDDAAHVVHLVPKLAPAATAPRRFRAG